MLKKISENLGIDARNIKGAAENLLKIMDEANYDDIVGFFDLGINAKEYGSFKRFLEIIAEGKIALEEGIDVKAFQKVLRKFTDFPNCKGCGFGMGGATGCPIVACCHEKGYLTCAECPDIQMHYICQIVNQNQIPSMVTDNRTYFTLITQRYMNWNVENLKKIIRKGYKQFIEEMREKVAKGFYSGKIISKERVFRDLLGF
jgi:hypothetical protein